MADVLLALGDGLMGFAEGSRGVSGRACDCRTIIKTRTTVLVELTCDHATPRAWPEPEASTRTELLAPQGGRHELLTSAEPPNHWRSEAPRVFGGNLQRLDDVGSFGANRAINAVRGLACLADFVKD